MKGSSGLNVGVLAYISLGSAKVEQPIFKSVIDPLDKFDDFDWNITRIIGSQVKGNVLLSPVSLKLVLAMLYEGAGGETSEELQQVLDISSGNATDSKYSDILKSLEVSEPDPGYELDVGMKLFIDKGATPKEKFAEKIFKKYNATIEKIDFSKTAEAVSVINNWAKSVSKGHIEHLVSDADTKATTVLLLLNAVYFKGLWLNPFPPNNTVEGKFKTGYNTYEPVQYMVGEFLVDYVDSSELKAQMIRLPYVGGKFAMYIILPENDYAVEDVIARLTPANTRSLITNMTQEAMVIVLPKFNFEYASSLAPFLQEMGITKAFSTEADFKGIAEGPKDLVVSNVIQKAVMDVNELGTVAAAVSSVELVNKFGMQTLMTFNVSRPFAFFIEEEKARTVVFVGKVVDPSDPGKAKVSTKPSYAAAAAGKPVSEPAPPSQPTTTTQPTQGKPIP